MLSNLTRSRDGKRQVLPLGNYTDSPGESFTLAILLHRGLPPRPLETYSNREGTGIDMPETDWYAIIEVE